MVLNLLKDIKVLLGSQSPRRTELLSKMGIGHEVVVIPTDESFDASLTPEEIVNHIALNKLKAFEGGVYADYLVITADTIVVHEGAILGKPKDKEEAFDTLKALQGKSHLVMSSVALLWNGVVHSFVETTEVVLVSLSDAEIAYYVDNFKPLDKAGSYGIQEWIGLVGIESIHGSYENVVGLPTARLYQKLKGLLEG